MKEPQPDLAQTGRRSSLYVFVPHLQNWEVECSCQRVKTALASGAVKMADDCARLSTIIGQCSHGRLCPVRECCVYGNPVMWREQLSSKTSSGTGAPRAVKRVDRWSAQGE